MLFRSRHTFISLLCRKNIDKLIIAKIVGQSDTEMIERVYYHIMQEEKDKAIMQIECDKSNIKDETPKILLADQLSGLDIDKLNY